MPVQNYPFGVVYGFFYDCVIIADKVKGEGRQSPVSFMLYCPCIRIIQTN